MFMFGFLEIVVFVALIRLLIETERPFIGGPVILAVLRVFSSHGS